MYLWMYGYPDNLTVEDRGRVIAYIHKHFHPTNIIPSVQTHIETITRKLVSSGQYRSSNGPTSDPLNGPPWNEPT
ncbi:hypothetical protein BDW42DRAFT_134759 [Aspergillus taichungensis]|uniref:Uncharacterized protein n=1 Tax=Aspergillus taichungensis TaxID=482145 RepID=A0A2J5HP86_9EURO|nr:hypothetical protein BDW42DRAFT_134759 [Aspergillus taichungensis]